VNGAALPDRPCQTPPQDSAKGFWEEPRWKGKPAPENPSPQWTRAAAMRRRGLIAGDAKADEENFRIHGVALARCASGGEILAALRVGDFYLFPLEERHGRTMTPVQRDTLPIGARWNLRGKCVELLQVITAAMMAAGGREGVTATLDELAAAVKMKSRTQVGDYLHALQAWGLLVADPVYVPYGRVHNQRGNCYRITTLCALTYRLTVRVPKGSPACWKLPEPRLIEPRPKRVRRPAGAPAWVYLPGAVGSRAHEVPNGNPEANPDTPIGESIPESLPVSVEKSSTLPASPGAARPCVPDAATDASQPVVPTKTRPAGLSRAVSDTGKARPYGESIARYRHGELDQRSRAGRLAGKQATDRLENWRRRAALEAQVAERKRAAERKVAELAREASMAAAPIATAPVERPPELTDWVESEEAKQLRLERARRRNNPLATDDNEFWDTIQNAWRGRGVDVDNGVLGHFIATQRGKKS
jgi:hypothetical protein